ncbi:hypothetical protein [Streptomyces decoyicus]|uniref:hypothetical protein n=1 Tax=Streptomyces decoyicus TaxID=249567 RepID=UPI0033B4B99E
MDSRFTGTRDKFTRPSWNAEISFTRSNGRSHMNKEVLRQASAAEPLTPPPAR